MSSSKKANEPAPATSPQPQPQTLSEWVKSLPPEATRLVLEKPQPNQTPQK